MQQSHHQQNGQNGQDDNRTPRPRDELEVYGQILASGQSNPLLRDADLGQGNYDDDYLWQQIRSYRKGLFAWIAFGNVLTERKIYETKMQLGEEGYNAFYDEVDADVQVWPPLDESESYPREVFPDAEGYFETQSRWNAIKDRGEELWQRLGEPDVHLSDKQLAAVVSKTGLSQEWMPIFWELVSGRHEASRSKNAELLRDALTGVKEMREQTESDGGLLS